MLAEATRQLAAVAAKIGETPPAGDHTAAAVILQGFKDLIQQLQSSRQNASRFFFLLTLPYPYYLHIHKLFFIRSKN